MHVNTPYFGPAKLPASIPLELPLNRAAELINEPCFNFRRYDSLLVLKPNFDNIYKDALASCRRTGATPCHRKRDFQEQGTRLLTKASIITKFAMYP